MPKISALPPVAEVDGNETVVMVKDGSTKRGPISDLVGAAVAPALVEAEEARDDAVNAKDLALLAAIAQGPFADTATGIAATANGDYFFTVNPANVYLNDNGSPQLQDEVATLGRSLGPFSSPLIDDGATTKEALESIATKLADDNGLQFLGAPKPPGARSRSAADVFNDVVRLKDFHAGNGTAAGAALAAAIVEAQARGIKRIVAGSGHYLLTNAALAAGITLEGDGESTRFTVGANNSNILVATSLDDVRIKGVRMEGDNTASDSTNGYGVVNTTSAGMVIEDVTFDGFGTGPLLAKNVSATRRRGPKLIRVKARNTRAASFADIFLAGAWDGLLFADLDMVSASQRAVLIADESGRVWRGAEVRGGWFEGYTELGVACTDEAWDGSDRVYGFVVRGGNYKNIGSCAVKAKLSKGILVDGVIAEGCGSEPENANSGLYGAILINSIGDITVQNCKLLTSGAGGIVTNGNDPYPRHRPSGFGLASINISNNQIGGVTAPVAATGDGIVHLGNCKSYTATGNQIRGVARHGIRVTGAAFGPSQFVTLSNNDVLDSPSSTGFGVYIQKCFNVQMDSNTVFNFTANCVVFEDCDTVIVGSCDQAGDSAAGGRCYTFQSVRNAFFDGKAICTFYSARASSTAYTVGQRAVLSNTDVVECVVAGITGAGAAPALAGGVAVDGTVTWAFVHKYRTNNAGLFFSGTAPQLSRIGSNARFDYLVGPGVDGTAIPTNLRWETIVTGTVTLSAGQAVFSFLTQETQPNINYRVHLQGRANETFWYESEANSGFTIKSSNASSTSKVDLRVYR